MNLAALAAELTASQRLETPEEVIFTINGSAHAHQMTRDDAVHFTVGI